VHRILLVRVVDIPEGIIYGDRFDFAGAAETSYEGAADNVGYRVDVEPVVKS
jgi:hypothetical protein